MAKDLFVKELGAVYQLNRWGWASQRDMNAIIAECSSSVELNTPRRKTLAESC
jgi:hypothetical protein